MKPIYHRIGRLFKTQDMKEQEIQELNILLGNPEIEISVSFLGVKKRFSNKIFAIGRALKTAKIFVEMDFDEELISTEDTQKQIAYQYYAVAKNGEKLADAVTLYFTDNKFWRWVIKRHILKNWSAKDLFDFVQKLIKSGDFGTFLTCIALTNGSRPTKANPIQ